MIRYGFFRVHYQSKVIVCVSVISGRIADNWADAVDWHLIAYIFSSHLATNHLHHLISINLA